MVQNKTALIQVFLNRESDILLARKVNNLSL